MRLIVHVGNTDAVSLTDFGVPPRPAGQGLERSSRLLGDEGLQAAEEETEPGLCDEKARSS